MKEKRWNKIKEVPKKTQCLFISKTTQITILRHIVCLEAIFEGI